MTETIEIINSNLGYVVELLEIILNGFSLLCIIAGVAVALVKGIQLHQSSDAHPLHRRFRMIFGGWLVVSLEFQLAADIVGTIISQTTAHLIQLGAIALIRTLLNYFLNKEIMEEREYFKAQLEKKRMKQQELIKIT